LPGTSRERDAFVAPIYRAEAQSDPEGSPELPPADIVLARREPRKADFMPKQTKVSRPSVALPYELQADARLDRAAGKVRVTACAGNTRFGKKAAGAPFRVYAPGLYDGGTDGAAVRSRCAPATKSRAIGRPGFSKAAATGAISTAMPAIPT